MNVESLIRKSVVKAVSNIYKTEIKPAAVQIQKTKKEFEGDITVVVFPLLRISKKKPEQTAEELGIFLQGHTAEIEKFNVIQGFLNLSIDKKYWLEALQQTIHKKGYGFKKIEENAQTIMLEYSSPNTNKPLHLGHIRNNLLGDSLSKILKANGHKVIKTNIVNDRGIHICKSMYAWQKWGNGVTPSSSGKKGDHLVGDFYVKFNEELGREINALREKGYSKEEAEKKAPMMKAVRKMLRKWESQDTDTRELWKMMNSWVYKGFDVTYQKLGVDFDKIYYESDTYLIGREMVKSGLEKEIFYKKEDNSVWADLTKEGLDHKILLRNDGTSVYMTQDIGMAKMRFEEYAFDKMVYVVGNEQNYHFQVLAIILDKLGFEWGRDLVHYSYGMVELPEGKMKSREGKTVDADDLIEEMLKTAGEMSKESGKMKEYPAEKKERIVKMIAMGALKYFILKVDPRKNMVFNPKESIDFNGNTGPFIQYSHARIHSVLRKAKKKEIEICEEFDEQQISAKELALIQKILEFPQLLEEASGELSPALIANYCYELAKEYNQFYHDFPILNANNQQVTSFRLLLSKQTGVVIKNGMSLLGIEVPERM